MTRAVAAAFALIVPLGLAQSVPEGIEVASIKPSHSASLCGPRFQPGGTMNAACVTVNDLIQWAFNLRPNQIAGGPEWARSAAYDITAKPERFETRQMPVYALIPAKDGVKLTDSGKPAQPGDMSMRGGAGHMIAQKYQPRFWSRLSRKYWAATWPTKRA